MHSLILFASGAGSNVRAIIEYFESDPSLKIPLIVSNRPEAPVLDIARDRGIPYRVVNKDELASPAFLEAMASLNPRFIVLAGFLWKIPETLIQAFPKKWINIHPAILPQFGGAGMYGRRVHEAVLASGQSYSGITIHYIDADYDTGPAIVQAYCPVLPDDDPDSLSQRIHKLEHYYYPRTLAFLMETEGSGQG